MELSNEDFSEVEIDCKYKLGDKVFIDNCIYYIQSIRYNYSDIDCVAGSKILTEEIVDKIVILREESSNEEKK